MTEVTWTALQRLLVDSYAEFQKRLTRRLGSEELASETLHETYLRLNRSDPIGTIENPKGYLFKAALHAAIDQKRAARRRLSRTEIKEVIDIADDAPGPAREAEARLQLEKLRAIIWELPRRQRAILVAARMKEVPHRKIAERFGISTRMVQIELKAALAYCRERLEKN